MALVVLLLPLELLDLISNKFDLVRGVEVSLKELDHLGWVCGLCEFPYGIQRVIGATILDRVDRETKDLEEV